MASTAIASLAHSPLFGLSKSPLLSSPETLATIPSHHLLLNIKFSPPLSLPEIGRVRSLRATRTPVPSRGFRPRCFFKSRDRSSGDSPTDKTPGSSWPILRRWDVPWQWQTVSLTVLACGFSFVLAGSVEMEALSYLGINIGELSLDEKAGILFIDQGITTAVVLGVLYSLTNNQPLPDNFFRYDLRDPFDLQKGWLLWAGIGLIGALVAISLTGVVMSFFSGETPQRETDALVRLLPLIGSSTISTAYLVGITGVLAPLLEETVFRGFLMVSLTKWLPTPITVLISASAFAIAHLTPGEFPQLFVLGSALGFSYAQTRNLLTPITIHALWNSGVIFLLTFLQVILCGFYSVLFPETMCNDIDWLVALFHKGWRSAKLCSATSIPCSNLFQQFQGLQCKSFSPEFIAHCVCIKHA